MLPWWKKYSDPLLTVSKGSNTAVWKYTITRKVLIIQKNGLSLFILFLMHKKNFNFVVLNYFQYCWLSNLSQCIILLWNDIWFIHKISICKVTSYISRINVAEWSEKMQCSVHNLNSQVKYKHYSNFHRCSARCVCCNCRSCSWTHRGGEDQLMITSPERQRRVRKRKRACESQSGTHPRTVVPDRDTHVLTADLHSPEWPETHLERKPEELFSKRDVRKLFHCY